MKERKLLMGASVLLILIFAVMFTACEVEETYEVYRFDWTYTAFSQSFTSVNLSVGYVYRTSLTNSQYDSFVALCKQGGIKSEELTEEDIEKYLKGIGINDALAKDATAKLIDFPHYFIGYRTNSTNVRVVVK